MTDNRSTAPAHAAGAMVLLSMVMVDPSGWYPFAVAKWAAVSVSVLVALWLALGVGRVTLKGWSWPVAGLVGLFSLSALFGRDPLYAWIGTPERHLGVMTWLLFVAALIAGTSIRSHRARLVLGRWVAITTLVAGAAAVVERFWGLPIHTGVVTDRVGGLFGSASFFGAALCLLIPVTGAMALIDRQCRFLWAIGFGGGAFALISTGTRAALVGIGFGAGLAVIAGWKRRSTSGESSPSLSAIVWPLGAMAVGCAAALLTFGGAADRAGGRGSSRIDEWAVGLRIIAAHPWLGVGPEGYRTVLADGVTADYERTYGREVLSDRAHNGLIDVAASGGLLAATLYVVLAAGVVVLAWRALVRGSALDAGLGVAVTAYLAQQWFLFPVATIDPVLWLFAGVLVARFTSGTDVDVSAVGWPRHTLVIPIAASFVVGVLGVAADRLAFRAVSNLDVSAATRATELRPDIARYRLLVASVQPESVGGIERSIEQIDAAVDLTPNDPIVLQRRAEALTRLAIATGARSDTAAAVEAWSLLADGDPNCYRCHLGLGYAHTLGGETDAAIDAFDRASELAPADSTEAADAVTRLRQTADR